MLVYNLNDHLENDILPVIDEEIARAADSAYSEDGTSLYDSVINTERDAPTIFRLADDAMRTFASRAFDICKYLTNVVYEQATFNDAPLYYVVHEDGVGPDTTTTETDFPVYTNKALSTDRILQFYVPDFDATNFSELAFAEISRYIALESVAAFLQQRSAALVPEYSARSQAALVKAITLLKSRKAPDESWS